LDKEQQADENFISRLKLDEVGEEEGPGHKSDKDDTEILRKARSIIAQQGAVYASRIKQKADDDAQMLEKLQRLFKEIEKRSIIEVEPDKMVEDGNSFTTTHAQNKDDGSGGSTTQESGGNDYMFSLLEHTSVSRLVSY